MNRSFVEESIKLMRKDGMEFSKENEMKAYEFCKELGDDFRNVDFTKKYIQSLPAEEQGMAAYEILEGAVRMYINVSKMIFKKAVNGVLKEGEFECYANLLLEYGDEMSELEEMATEIAKRDYTSEHLK